MTGHLAEEMRVQYLAHLGTVKLGAEEERLTSHCLTGACFSSPVSNLRSGLQLPPVQKALDRRHVAVMEQTRRGRFRDVIASLFRRPPTTPTQELHRLILGHSSVISLTHIEQMVRRAIDGEATNIACDGKGNFAFAEAHEPGVAIIVAVTVRGQHLCQATTFPVDWDYVWSSGHRFLIPCEHRGSRFEPAAETAPGLGGFA